MLSKTYAAVVSFYVVLLLAFAVRIFVYGGHGAPAGMLFLIPSVLLAPLIVFLWRGRLWASLVTFGVSLIPGMWPLLWYDVAAGHTPSGLAMLFLAPPVVFLMLTIAFLTDNKRRSSLSSRTPSSNA